MGIVCPTFGVDRILLHIDAFACLGNFLGFAHAGAYLAHAVSDHKYVKRNHFPPLTTADPVNGYYALKLQAPAA